MRIGGCEGRRRAQPGTRHFPLQRGQSVGERRCRRRGSDAGGLRAAAADRPSGERERETERESLNIFSLPGSVIFHAQI